MPSEIEVWNENVRSPATSSPLVPSSTSDWVAEPPIAVRSQVTVRPVLVGFAPGVTSTVSRVASPANRLFGVAAPTPLGSVGPVQLWSGDAELRGVGASAAKSALLSSVSVQPPLARSTAVVFDVPGAAAEPS